MFKSVIIENKKHPLIKGAFYHSSYNKLKEKISISEEG